MRICILSDGYPPWDRGGAQRIAAQVAEGYAERGHDVAAISTVPDREDVGTSVRGGVTVHRLWTPRPRAVLPYATIHNPLVAGECDRRLAEFDPDVVHAHNAHWLSNAALRAAAERAPVVKTYHDAGTVSYGELTGFVERGPPDDDPIPTEAYRASPAYQLRNERLRYFPPRNELNRRCLHRSVDLGVAVSAELRRALTANGMPCRDVIHNGIDADAFATGHDHAGVFRQEYDLGEDRIVLFGGRTSYNKGGWHLARAFRRVAASLDEPVRLVVTGDEKYVPEMREAAGQYGDRILSTGWISREQLRGAFRAADVVTSPSVHLDPFPTVNLEAFASGTPVVTSRYGGAKELVDHGESGFVVDPLAIDELASALKRLLADPDAAAEFGATGRRTVRDEFTVERQIEAYLDALRSVA